MKPLMVLCLLLLAGLIGRPPHAGDSPERQRDAPRGDGALTPDAPQRFAYRDDHDGRVLAVVEIVATGGGEVEMRISAVGASVEPIPGFEGVRGGNRFTAEQLAHLLSGRFPVKIETESVATSERQPGSVAAGRYGRLPERRLEADGRINYLAQSRRQYPLEMIVRSGRLSPGEHRTEVVVNGSPRLRLTYRVAGRAVEVIGFASVAEARPAEPVAVEAVTAPAGSKPVGKDKEEKPLPPPVADADWDARDLEAKWVLFRASMAEFAAWKQYLAKRKDFAFLEWIAVYGENSEEQMGAAWALAKADAPQWLRVVAWLREAYPVNHDEGETHMLLVKHAPARAFAWLDKHKEHFAVSKRYVYQDYMELQKQKLPPADVGRLLPPLDAAFVFRHMDAPKDLAELGPRLKAEPGKVYLHQVQRAIKALATSNRYEQPWVGQLRLLTRHRHPEVRQSAYLAYTHVAPALEARPHVLEEFLEVVDSAGEPAALREAALLALSYFGHPSVFVKLLRIAAQPEHPAWRAALSRLGDLGHDFTLVQLDRLAADKLPPQDQRLLESIRAGLTRLAQERTREAWAPLARSWLEYAAWAEQSGDPLKQTLGPWTVKAFAAHGDSRLTAELHNLAVTYTPSFPIPGGEEEFRQRVRGLARAILAAREKGVKTR